MIIIPHGSWDGYEGLIVPVVLVGLYFAVRNFLRARGRHRDGNQPKAVVFEWEAERAKTTAEAREDHV
jgi:hypothetical protein